jgi:amino acid adenylation domain-containing protein
MEDTARRIAALSPEKRALLARRLAQQGTEFRTFPLSFAQERLWALHQLDPRNPAYNLAVAKRLRGRLDVAALERTLGEIVRRHEVLRTRFVTVQGRPLQAVVPAAPLELPLTDLTARPAAEREAEARRLAGLEASAPFDLSGAPPVRVRLFRLGGDDHVLLVTLHHVVADAWSMEIVVAEVAALYGAFSASRPSPLPEPAVQYADYALWQREEAGGAALERSLAYWRERLAGAPPLVTLPADRPRPALASLRGGTLAVDLPPATVAGLTALSRQENATLYMVLLAAFQVLLSRLSGQTDVVVGSPVANRERREIQGLIGFFVNTLALRADLAGDPGFRTHLRRVRDDVLEAQAHQDAPFERVVDALSPERSTGQTPLFQVVLGFNDAGRAVLELPDLAVVDFEVENRTAKFDLVLNCVTGPGGVRGVAHFATDLFDEATVTRYMGHFVELLGGIVAAPDRRVSELPLMGAAERQRVLVEWGRARARHTPQADLYGLFREQARRTPEALAVTFKGARMTYRQLDERAGRLASWLRARGVGADRFVGVCVEPSLELVVALLGVLGAGGAYLPLDPAYPEERLAFMLEDSGARLVLSQEHLRERLPAGVEGVSLDSEWGRIRAAAPFAAGEPPPVDAAAYVIYTSGSTGRPKGVVVSHANVVRLFEATRRWFDFGPADVWTLFHSFAFDFSVWELWGPLLHGGRLVVVPYAVSRSPEAFLALLEREGVTVLNQTPSAFQQLIAAEAAARADGGWSRLRLVIFGGEALHPRRLVPWIERHGDAQPRLVNMYGITETTVHVTYREVPEAVARGAWGSPIGVPIDDLYTYTLDAHQQPLPIGVAGELYVGGAGLARGYLNRPDLTAQRFVPDPYAAEPGARMYRTGDVGRRRADGELEYLGRSDHQVKVRGFRIELGEIEAALRRRPDVRDVAVLRVDEGAEGRLVAWVVWRQHEPPVEELRVALRRSLPEHMVPSAFVALERLPLTHNGKLDRASLPLPGAERPELAQAFVAARTPLERDLALRWSQVLGLERVGVHDNFFDVGGDSIKAAMFINRLREDLGEIVHVVTIFDAPTIEQFAAYLAEHCPRGVARLLGEAALPAASTPARAGEGGRIDAAMVSRMRAVLAEYAPRPRADEAARPKLRPAVFVLSPPRSGSTLLRVMLAAHARLFVPPEMDLLSFAGLRERKAAFSGRNSLWLEGSIRAVMEIKGCSADEGRALMEQCEKEDLGTPEFYRRLQEWVGDAMLVDKSPFYAQFPEILERAEACFDGALYIHLIRHPLSMIHSYVEAKIQEVLRYPAPFAPRQMAELTWLLSHLNVRRFLAGVPARRQIEVRFEDLVRAPRGVMERLCAFLGIEFDPLLLDPYAPAPRRMTDGLHRESHMLGDMKFHQHSQIDAATADRWREEGGAELLGDETLELARSLGYLLPDAAPGRAGAAEQVSGAGATPGAEPAALPPLTRVARADSYQLSFAQERLWFLDQLEPGNPFYNIPISVRLTGHVDVEVLERVLTEIVRRHEILRTRIVSDDGRPVQVVAPTARVSLPLHDLGGLPAEQREAEVRRLVDEELRRPFDLAADSPLRASLVRLGDDEHVALVTMHHIASDGWSMGVLLRELNALYAAFVRGEPSPLSELPVQYADFAAWQRQWLRSEVVEAQLEYWRHKLAGSPPLLPLPTDRPRPAEQSYNGAGFSGTLPRELAEGLKDLARREGVTLYMLLLSAFQALLRRVSGQADVSLGTDVTGRTRSELEALIGFFVNAVVIRVDLPGDPTFRELLAHVRRTALEAYRHQDVPFERVVEALNPQRSLAYAPLFQVMFVFQNMPKGRFELPGLSLEPVHPHRWAAKHDLSLFAAEAGGGLEYLWIYSTDLFDEATVVRLAQRYRQFLEAAVADPETRLSALGGTEPEPERAAAPAAVGRTRLRQVRPQAVSVAPAEIVRTRPLEGATLPLVVEPAVDDFDAPAWLRANRAFIDAQLHRHGALLLRGFGVRDASDFEALAKATCGELFAEYNDLPREGLGGSVYASTPYPPDKAILFHNESSHLHRWPMRILFACLQPALEGGETPVVDCREVYRRLDPALRERFARKGLMYVRHFIDGLDASWEQFFHTTSRAEVEAFCARAGIELEWTAQGGLRTRYRCQAVARHPRTGEAVFFNQIALHHVSRLDAAVTDSLRALLGEDELPRNVHYGDGTPIETAVVDEVCAACDAAAVAPAWRQGDVMLLDNMLAAHARRPYSGPRRIVVAMGDMFHRADLPSFDPDATH